jgi:hypothetical protein
MIQCKEGKLILKPSKHTIIQMTNHSSNHRISINHMLSNQIAISLITIIKPKT